MADAECPICTNSFEFEQMRSLYCGHTYCSSCIEQIIDTNVLRCPACRLSFTPGQVIRLFITHLFHYPSLQGKTEHHRQPRTLELSLLLLPLAFPPVTVVILFLWVLLTFR
ncbi:hypothetical protein EI94DRAFT_891087 [Lactarius quietus]|nr:hypothetical protein EI94DRAFT_891087 [Lactarius quietus]